MCAYPSDRLMKPPTPGEDTPAQQARGNPFRDTSELYRLLVDRVQDYAIFALDTQGYILSWNAGAERLKGYTREEAIGQHFSIFYPPDEANSGKLKYELDVATTVGEYQEEGWRLRKDGSRFWANVLITAIRDDNGELVGFAKVTRDLTERRAAHERALEDARRIAAQEAARVAAEQRAHELRALAEQLRLQTEELEWRSAEAESANRTKSQFLAAISHELRTPLNAIGGYAELMQLEIGGPLTEQQRDQIHRIQRSQKHLLGIINDTLNFSRIEAAQVMYDIRPIELSDVIDAVTPMVLPQARTGDLRLIVRECPSGLVVQADRAKVEQILLNLLSNAIKFTEAGGEIEVACGDEGDQIWLSVRDTGLGIPTEQQEAIFAPFVQVGRTLANPKEGTGLGLSISRELARAMHGDLTVKSREREGSVFTLTLPRTP